MKLPGKFDRILSAKSQRPLRLCVIFSPGFPQPIPPRESMQRKMFHRFEANLRMRPRANRRDASPATLRPTSRPCTRRKPSFWAAPIATAETLPSRSPQASPPNSSEYEPPKKKRTSSRAIRFSRIVPLNPERAYTKWLKETPEYVRFVNPGDLRVAPETCGSAGCHAQEVRSRFDQHDDAQAACCGARRSTTTAAFPIKIRNSARATRRDGRPQSIRTIPPPTPEETRTKGVLPELEPLYRWEISQPGNVLRVFERGGERKVRS